MKIVIFITEVITAFNALRLALIAIDTTVGRSKILKLLVAIGSLAGGIYAVKDAFDETKDSVIGLNEENPLDFMDGLDSSAQQIKKTAIDLGKVFDGVYTSNKNNLATLREELFTTGGLTKTITDGLNTGIKSFSDGIARSIVLGENLNTTFRKIAQDALVKIMVFKNLSF